MRRSEFNIEDKEIIKEILDECESGTLSLISKGKPYGVAVNFVYYEDKIYIHGAKEGRKVESIRENPFASFLVINPFSLIPSYFSDTMAACPATQFFASVICEGNIKTIDNPNKKAIVLNKLMEKLQSEGGYETIAFDKPMYKKMLENTAVFELDIQTISCKVKVGQNLLEDKKEGIIDKLQKRDSKLDKKTIEMINKFYK